MVEAHINSKRPKYHVTDQATASDGINSLLRSYTWGLDASGSMQGAGGSRGTADGECRKWRSPFPDYSLPKGHI
jgi:hypothetical protein